MNTLPQIAETTQNLLVWLVEDHDLFRRTLMRLCVPERGIAGAQDFANAEAMLNALREAGAEEKPKVLLLDVGLPGRSGLEVIAEIMELAPECRVVILTVFEDEQKIRAAISAGACGYLVKTARPEEIVAAIHHAADGGAPMSPTVAASVVNLLAKLTKTATRVSLSPRESEILGLIVKGMSAKEISKRLEVSIHTADTHTRNLFKKLEVNTRAAAVARAIREKLV
ncbi:MAG: response regulator transcription factor [Akkermansiaceae bacterium]|jgi:DNA-binding NarL/FixJ family response regulator|nr:response regulator transcription factor [Akkermansiaceae bacterium]MDP4779310.1 response regulator transcription factor [Akkermansiaceae bacterium]